MAGRRWVAGAGVVWAALCAWLAYAGHVPKGVLLPVPPETAMAVQAVLVLPLLLLVHVAMTRILDRALAHTGRERPAHDAASVAGQALGGGLLLQLLPECGALALGIPLLRVALVVVPLSSAGMLAWLVRGLLQRGVPWRSAVVAAAKAWGVFVLVSLVFLR